MPPPKPAGAPSAMDQDYRLPFPIDNITLPPPPPPPPISEPHEQKKSGPHHRHRADDTVDMDLSDDDPHHHHPAAPPRKPMATNDNLRVITPVELEPPPPFVDDNMFLADEGEPDDLEFDGGMSFVGEDEEMQQEPAMLPPPLPAVVPLKPGILGAPTMLLVPPPMMHPPALWPNNGGEQVFRGRGRAGGFGRGAWFLPGRGGDRGAGGFRGRPPRGGRGGWGGGPPQRGFVPRGGRGRGNFRAGFRGGGF